MIAAYLSRQLSIVLAAQVSCLSLCDSTVTLAQGRLVARYPWPFLVVPIAISIGLGSVLVKADQISTAHNALSLYVPNQVLTRESLHRHQFSQGLSRTGRNAIVHVFGDVYESEQDPINGVIFTIVLSRQDNGDILRNNSFFRDYMQLRRRLETIAVPDGRRYEQMCLQVRVGVVLKCNLASAESLPARHMHAGHVRAANAAFRASASRTALVAVS